MKNIVIVLIFLSIIGAGFIVYYFGLVKNIVPENLFGKADVFSDKFQFVGEVNLDNNEAENSGNQKEKIIQPKSTGKLTKSMAEKLAINNQPVIASKIAVDNSVVATASVATATSVAPIAIVATTALATAVETPTTTAPILTQASGNVGNHVIVSEVLVGIDSNANYEFIELYNPNDNAIDLAGWAIKKRSSTGSESTLISNNTKAGDFKDKKIMPKSYLLLVQKDGYSGSVQPDILYSGTLAYKDNAVVLYNAAGEAIEDVGWDEIAKGQSLERVSITDWANGDFKVQNNPNPQNSQN